MWPAVQPALESVTTTTSSYSEQTSEPSRTRRNTESSTCSRKPTGSPWNSFWRPQKTHSSRIAQTQIRWRETGISSKIPSQKPSTSSSQRRKPLVASTYHGWQEPSSAKLGRNIEPTTEPKRATRTKTGPTSGSCARRSRTPSRWPIGIIWTTCSRTATTATTKACGGTSKEWGRTCVEWVLSLQMGV